MATESWTLNDVGQRLATLLVYARVQGNGAPLCNGATLLDDILYAPQPPRLIRATVVQILNTQVIRAQQKRAILSLEAEDQALGSGVDQMQIDNKQVKGDVGIVWL